MTDTPSITRDITREHWLHAGTDKLRPLFQSVDAALPATVHLSIGFPSKHATSRARRRIGECWHGAQSADGAAHVFISPVLVQPVDVLDTLAHELVHVVTPGAGHKGKFVSVAKAIGLTANKPTSAGAGPELRAALEQIAGELGPLPHVGLTVLGRERVQSTRMVKCMCAECGYTVRTTRKWLMAATPVCPIHSTEMEVNDV